MLSNNDSMYFPVSPLLLTPHVLGSFSVYVLNNDRLTLYAKSGEAFTMRHRIALFENGTEEVYIRTEQRKEYGRYLEHNLGELLINEEIPLAQRAGAFHCATAELLRTAFSESMSAPIDSSIFNRIQHITTHSVRFLSNTTVLGELGRFLSHDFNSYTHSLNVFVYTISLLHRLHYDETKLISLGIGIMLHDIGMSRIPSSVVRRRWDSLSNDNALIEMHPLLGVAQVTHVPLSQEAIHCILLHHESLDGNGYPSKIEGQNIPQFIRALSIADIYDSLTSCHSSMRCSPFIALHKIRSELASKIDIQIFQDFVIMLSDSGLDES